MAGPVLTPDRPAADRPALSRSAPERRTPAVVHGGRDTGVRRRARTQWLVLAAALVVLAGSIVAWALGRAAERVDVVSVARPLSAGQVIGRDDLTVTAVAFDQPVTGLVPASALDELVGRTATIDLRPGTLVSVGMWADATQLSPGERTVGAVLAAGRFPDGLAEGSRALALGTDDPAVQIEVRVLSAQRGDDGRERLTLAVAEADAATVAHLSADGALVLVGIPVAAADDADAAGAGGAGADAVDAGAAP